MSRPIHLVTEVEIDQPAAVVWEVVADYGADPDWRRGVSTMDPSVTGTVTTATTTREVLRFAGRTWHNDGEVVSVDPGRSFSWRTTRGAQAEGSRTVEPMGPERCRVRLELTVVPGPSEKLMVPLLRRMLARNLAGDGRRLHDLMVSREGSGRSTAR